MGRDEGRAVEDADRLLADRDLDVIAHQPMRHAAPEGLDIDERVVRHATPHTLLTARQRARGQRTQCGLLIPEKPIERALVGRAVDAPIGELHPCGHMLLESGK